MSEPGGELELLAMKSLGMDEEEFAELLTLSREEQSRVIAEKLGEASEEVQTGEPFLIQCYRKMSAADRQVVERVAAALANLDDAG